MKIIRWIGLRIVLAELGVFLLGHSTYAGQDRWQCSATCIAVSPSKRTLEILGPGPVIGTSQLNTLEAFQVLAQECENRARKTGYGSSTTLMFVRSLHVSMSTSQESQTTVQAGHTWLKAYHWYDSSSRSASSESFSFTVDSASPAQDCGPLSSTPGTPKYIGPGTPAG